MACCGCGCSLFASLRGKPQKKTPVPLSHVPETQPEPHISTAKNDAVTVAPQGVKIPEASPETLSGRKPELANSALPTTSEDQSLKEHKPRQPEELWELAYDRIRSEDGDPKLTKAYEAVLSRIGDKPAPTLPEKITDVPEVEDTARQETLKKAVEDGLKRTQRLQEAKQFTGDVLTAVLSAKQLIGNALSLFPQAAAAWTGVTLVFEGFATAATQSQVNRDGIVYVASRVEWYCALHRIADENIDIRYSIEERLIELFKKVVMYQMRSVGYYFKNQLLETVFDAFKVHDWEKALNDIKKDEDALRHDANSYDDKRKLGHLSSMERLLSSMEKSAEELQRRITDQLSEILKANKDIVKELGKVARRQASKIIGRFYITRIGKRKTYDYEDFMHENPDEFEGTCNWFLEDNRITLWKQGLLFVTAPSKQGKSVLAKFLVKKWRGDSGDGVVCYFFFNKIDEFQDNAASGFCALLHQLFLTDPTVAEIEEVNSFILQHGKGLTHSAKNVWKVIEMVLKHFRTRPVMIILDALDQCVEDRPLVLQNLQSICNREGAGNIKALVTTQPVDDIMGFKDIPTVSLDPKDRPKKLDSDIEMFIDEKLVELAQELGWAFYLADGIKSELMARAEKLQAYSFLWLTMSLKYIKSQSRLSDEKLINMVKELPSAVDNIFEILLSSFDKDDARSLAVEGLFTIMIAAEEPLTSGEVNIAMGVFLQKSFGEGYWRDERTMTSWIQAMAKGLVEIHNNRVQFTHRTVREFLVSSKENEADSAPIVWRGFTTEAAADLRMRDICALYLEHETELWKREKSELKRTWENSGEVPVWDFPTDPNQSERFLLYALQNCPIHHRNSKAKNPGHVTAKGFSYPFNKPPIAFVKSGKAEDLLPSVHNQYFARHHLDRVLPQDREDIRVPEPYRVIRSGSQAYVITEYVSGQSYWDKSKIADVQESDRMLNHIARALTMLLSFPIVADMLVGPVGGGHIVHPLFTSRTSKTSGVRLRSTKDLEGYLNKVLERSRNGKGQPMQVSLGENHFLYTKLSGYEFIFGESQVLYIVSFQNAAVLPLGFLDYALAVSAYGEFGEKLKSRLHLPDNSRSLEALLRASKTLEVEAGKLQELETHTYFSPPSRILPPPYGPLDLGDLIRGMDSLLLPKWRHEVPKDQIYRTVEDYSIPSGDRGTETETSHNDLTIKSIETIGFNPTEEYLLPIIHFWDNEEYFWKAPEILLIIALRIARAERKIQPGTEAGSSRSETELAFVIGVSFAKIVID